jgi:tetratricopeptide (TPR) repeat protein
MNAKLKLFFFSLLVSMSCAGQKISKNPYVTNYRLDSISYLTNIGHQIDNALSTAIVTKSSEKLDIVNQELGKIQESENDDIIIYWIAYNEYSKSIYFLQVRDTKNAEKSIRNGIDLIDKMNTKNAEDYALLGLMQSFLMQFENSMRIPSLFNKIKKNLELAIQSDNENFRVYYTKGSFNFYTPKSFGGGKTVEVDLTKAIRLPEKNKKNTYLPTWGKEDSYLTLIEFYINEKRKDNAIELFQEAIKKYPNNYRLNSLASKLVGK